MATTVVMELRGLVQRLIEKGVKMFAGKQRKPRRPPDRTEPEPEPQADDRQRSVPGLERNQIAHILDLGSGFSLSARSTG
ncbi:hypothetical protein EYF80_033567 [Liparis tanakae]|uniref:Uncharacterized protein n=1 Tax=Liparis tanakae TaxID=230148 RepID=A0A4Z2GSA7_9TELE|nr:hypothetical protein EYF80_033567 [Liparis tanakae]